MFEMQVDGNSWEGENWLQWQGNAVRALAHFFPVGHVGRRVQGRQE